MRSNPGKADASALKLLAKVVRLFNEDFPMSNVPADADPVPSKPSLRRRTVLETARQLGLLGGENSRIGGRVHRGLLAAAKAKSGIASDTELLEYALARVALEDDFATRLVRRKGRVGQDIDLEF